MRNPEVVRANTVHFNATSESVNPHFASKVNIDFSCLRGRVVTVEEVDIFAFSPERHIVDRITLNPSLAEVGMHEPVCEGSTLVMSPDYYYDAEFYSKVVAKDALLNHYKHRR